jgi:chemotaxis family two-component system response regulator Rcp1
MKVMPMDILMVEDNEGDAELVKRALREGIMPCSLTAVRDGEEALDFLSKRGKFAQAPTPHLILLDLNMPRMDGKTFLAAVKQDEALKTIPVVVLTGSKAHADVTESYALHANCYIVKPFDGREFMNAIRQAVNFWRHPALLPAES